MLTFAAAFVSGLILCLYLDLNWAEGIVLILLWCFRGFLAHCHWIDRMETAVVRFASRRAACIALAFVIPIALRVALLSWEAVPEPWVPDEFSHRLIADTFAHGRLSNPTHPLWQHFESIHVFFQPTYASPYFPGLGAIMAVGKLLGHYWIGVLFAGGAMCAALLWMLYGWLPPQWALLGAILAILRWGMISYWINSYWGGSLAAVGGALVFGAYARMRRGRAVWSASAIVGAGLIILISTRPFEGALIFAPLGIALFVRRRAVAAFVPAAVIAAAGIVALGFYNKAITGNAFRVPYRVNQALYGWPLALPWQHPAAVSYRNAEMSLYYEYERDQRAMKSSPLRALEFASVNLSPCWRFYFGPALTLAVAWAGGSWWKSRRVRLPLICCIVAGSIALMLGAYPHYIAPALGCFVVLMIQALRRVRRMPGVGLERSRTIVAACLVMLPVRAFVNPAFLPNTLPGHHVFSTFGSEKGRERARILEKLEHLPGGHIVFARYHRERYTITEWVYNGADINGQKVVWARDLGADSNREALRYFPDRTAWMVNVDDAPEQLIPYQVR